MSRKRIVLFAGLLGALLGCNAPEPPGNTGGTDQLGGRCGRGAVVISSDYQSTNVGLMGWDGGVLSASIVSSASTSTGLSAPFSGDVIAPAAPVTGERMVLIDRFPASVLTWVDVKSGEVEGQLSVATGFTANAQDYLEVSPEKAYVPRLEPNLDPGMEPFDAGSDLLIVDPRARAILGRVDLTSTMAGEDPKFYPRPNRVVRVGDKLYALLGAYSLSFLESAESRLAVIDVNSDEVEDVVVLAGMHGCTALAASASGVRIAVGCSGTFSGNSMSNAAEAGLVLLARGQANGLVEERRWTAADLGEGPLGFSVAFAAEDRVLLTTFGYEASGGAAPLDDTLMELDLATGEHRVLLRSTEAPFTLGEVRCTEACGRCLVADAATDGGVVHRFDFDADRRALVQAGSTHADPRIGLPPRYLGAF